jgi:Endonuclease NucS
VFQVDIQNKQLIELTPTSYATLGLKERFDIQEWIEKSPGILGEELLMIGKEVILSSGKRLDLLCVDKSAALVVVELKRDDSGSDVEWQAIKYVSYCSNFSHDEIFRQFAQYAGCDSASASKTIEEFIDCDIESLNKTQRIILAAKDFNSEVISAILWLSEFSVDIQCTRLAPFTDKAGNVFIKPETIIPLPEAKDYIERKELKQRKIVDSVVEWTGYWFVNVGESVHRAWEDNMKYGFIGAGQGRKFSQALKRLSVGDKIYAYMKGHGYVGFGEVVSPAEMIRDFVVLDTQVPLLNAGLTALRAGENSDDESLSEWVVGVRWNNAVAKNQAKTFAGVFANQNIVCKLRHEQTLKFVQHEFGQ